MSIFEHIFLPISLVNVTDVPIAHDISSYGVSSNTISLAKNNEKISAGTNAN